MADQQPNFWARLKQHHIYRVAAWYGATIAVLIQVVARAFPYFGWSVAVPAVIIILIAGFPVAIVLAWLLVKPTDTASQTAWQKRRWKLGAIVTPIVIAAVVISGIFAFRFSEQRAEHLAAERAVTVPTTASATSAPAATTVIPAKSIAVLPFVNMSGDPKEDYFSDGITEEILNALAQVHGLKVAGRTSAFAFKGKAEDLRKVGEALDVATVLEGSVQKSGDEVRITAQLIDTRSGYHLWSEKYDRKLTSIFAVEDEISKTITDKLEAQLNGGSQPLVSQQAVDPRAHDFYLHGLTFLAQRSVDRAGDAFRQAVTIDPNYAQGWAALAEAEALLPTYQLDQPQAANTRALTAAQRALTLDPSIVLAYVAQGMVYTNQMRWSDADRAFRRALALAPGDAEAMDQYAQFLFGAGQLEPALAAIERALQYDPLSGVSGAVRAENLLALHRYNEALVQIESVLTANPDNLLGHRVAELIYLALQRYPQAEAQMRWIGENKGNGSVAGPLLVRGIADPRMRANAVQELETSPALAGIRHDAIVHALFLTRLGEHQRALALLEGYAFNGDSTTPQLLWVPAFDPIRNDPRFKMVLKKIGLPYKPTENAGDG